jgi:hypothetical protein
VTIYLISGAVLFVVAVFMYAYRQGKRMAYLDVLNNGNKLSNEAREKIKEIDAKYRKKIKKISRSSAMRFWDRGMRDNGSKKP